MDFSANHTGFVIASYALSFAFLGLLIAATLRRDAKNRREAERLDAQRKAPRT